MKYRLAFFMVVVSALGLSSCSTTAPAAPSSISHLWVATSDQLVRLYALDRTKGSISPVGSDGQPAVTGVQASAIAISPDGTTAFIANAGSNSISVYLINQDGSLSPADTILGVETPSALAVDPTGALLFAANFGSDTITVYKTSPVPGFLLTLIYSFPIVQSPPGGSGPVAPSGPVALAVSPNTFPCLDSSKNPLAPVTRNCYAIYAANKTSGTVTAYDYFLDASGNFVLGSIDLNDIFIFGGTVPGSPYASGANPSGLALSRCAGVTSTTRLTSCPTADGNNLFVANSGSNNVTIFSACIQLPTCLSGGLGADGTLKQVGSVDSPGTAPGAVLVDPAADFVYVVDQISGQVSEYGYSGTFGALTSLGATPAIGATADGTSWTGAITTSFANAANTGNWVLVAGNNKLYMFAVGSNGALTQNSSQFDLGDRSASAMAIR